jgi:hypothetical protein
LAGVGVKAGTFFQSTRLAASIRLEIARKSPALQLIGTPRKRTISAGEVDHGQGHEHRSAAG